MTMRSILGLVPITAVFLFAAPAGELSWLEVHLTRPMLYSRQTMTEAQIHLASRVKPVLVPPTSAAWEKETAQLREQILKNVVFRGEAARWRQAPTREEWFDVIEGNGYRIRKFRYEVVPGLWLPGLLYEPARLSGRVPVVINLNGHEGDGIANSYIQERCITLARKGMLALNYEWFFKGQMSADGYAHYRLNQLDLTGTSGLAPFILAQTRLVDIALKHPNADPNRVAATGLSGGGWQTILLSALDPRIKLAVPVAGYSSFVTRTQFPDMDLGDSEQTPVDLGVYADYTHLTAMLAPRPSLLVNNARDNCCFRADYAVSPLLVAARPVFNLFGKADHLRYHANFDPGHNYGLDNRQALYRFLGEFFFPGVKDFSAEEPPATGDLRKPADFRVPLPENNASFNSLALKLSENLPKKDSSAPPELRKKLRDLLRWPEYQVTVQQVRTEQKDNLRITATKLSMSGIWTVPALEFAPEGAEGTTLVLADLGKATLAGEVQRLLEQKRRVVAMDPFNFGEARIESRDYLFALLVSALGERPLGIQASQVAAASRWLSAMYGPVTVAGFGPRTSLIALAAAAVETEAIREVKLTRSMSSLKEILRRNLGVNDAPELFCFGLLEWFDIPQLKALVAPRACEGCGA